MLLTDSVQVLRACASVADHFGVRASDVWSAAGVDPTVVAPFARVDVQAYNRVLEHLIQKTGRDDVSTEIVTMVPLERYGMLAFTLASAIDLQDLLQRVARFARGWTEGHTVSLEVGPEVAIYRGTRRAPFCPAHGWRVATTLVTSVLWADRLLARSFQPLELVLEIAEPRNAPTLFGAVNCPIRFGANENKMVIRAADLRIPVRPVSDHGLVPTSEGLIGKPLRDAFAGATHPLRDVRRAIVAELAAGVPTLEAVAARLGLAAEDLNALLDRSGVHHRDLVDDVRRSFVLAAMEGRSIQEVAALSGFHDLGAFCRTFKRWTGQTPSAHRRARATNPRLDPIEVPQGPTTSTALASLVLTTAVSEYSVDPAPLWSILGIDPTAPPEPTARIESARSYAFIEALVEVTDLDDVCLRIRERLRVPSFGVFGLAMATSSDVRDLLNRLARFFPFWDELRLAVEPSERRVRLSVSWQTPPRLGLHLHVAAVLGNTIIQTSRGAGVDLVPCAVSLPGTPPRNLETYARIFRAPIEFGARDAFIEFDASVLALPLSAADPAAAEVLAAFLEGCLARLPGEPCTVREVRGMVAALLPAGEARIQTVSSRLATTPRTLQRRLAEGGVCFEDVVDDARRQLAIQHIRGKSMSLGEIALATGFSDASSFHRAFRRWTGVRPSEWRSMDDG